MQAEDGPKLMLAVPGDTHPVFIFIACESVGVAISIEVERLPSSGNPVAVSLNVGSTALHSQAMGEDDGPTGPTLRFGLPLGDAFWDVLSRGERLIVASPALATAQEIGLRGITEPLGRFRRACAGRTAH